jgi:hypothetical protein
MKRIFRPAPILLAIAFLALFQAPAHAFIGVLMMADAWVKKEAKIALATPGHVEWCAEHHTGYRKEWNNYPIGDGRIKFCASPFYTPPWLKWSANLPK